MKNDVFKEKPCPLKELTQQALLDRALSLVAEERKVQLALIECLREVDRRSLHLQMGYSSLWDFAIKYLKLSEGAAYRRIAAMRLSSEVPEAKKALESGHLSLSNASKLHSFFLKEKKQGVTRSSKKKGELIGQILQAPSGELPSSSSEQAISQVDLPASAGISQKECERKLADLAPHLSWATEKVRAIPGGKTELKLVLDASVMNQLEELKNLLAHQVPRATYSEIVGIVIGEALEGKNRKIFGKLAKGHQLGTFAAKVKPSPAEVLKPTQAVSSKPLLERASPLRSKKTPISPSEIGFPSSRIRRPLGAPLRQEVWIRAGGQCEYIVSVGARAGQRCQSRHALEVDHRLSVAEGGTNHLENLNLLCESHHKYKTAKENPHFKIPDANY